VFTLVSTTVEKTVDVAHMVDVTVTETLVAINKWHNKTTNSVRTVVE
jgi:hypothetical protein